MLWQEKVTARIADLEGRLTCCSDREIAILAASMEEVISTKKIDPVRELMVIQVVTQCMLDLLLTISSTNHYILLWVAFPHMSAYDLI